MDAEGCRRDLYALGGLRPLDACWVMGNIVRGVGDVGCAHTRHPVLDAWVRGWQRQCFRGLGVRIAPPTKRRRNSLWRLHLSRDVAVWSPLETARDRSSLDGLN